MLKTNYYFPCQRKFSLYTIGLISFLCMVFTIGLVQGAVPVSFTQLGQYFAGTDFSSNFVLKLRFNREVIAIFCGGMLAMGSAMLQGLTRNPMVAPDFIGMTSLGCLLIVACEIFWIKSPVANILFGTLGAMLGFFLCFSFSKKNYKNYQLTVILTGISISFSATAFMQLLILKAPQEMDDYLHFLTGTLYAVSDSLTLAIVAIGVVIVPTVLVLSKRWAVFALDDQTAQSIGAPLKRFRAYSFLMAALLVGTSVIGVGNMGFLGIVAPNLARIIVGNRPTYVLTLSFLIGGLIYLLADTLGRCLLAPAEIPAGIMTNMMGAPLFLYILLRYSRGQHEWT